MPLSQRLGHRVRALRDARRLSLEALAERSAVSRSNISLIERGASSPTAVVLDKLATALGVSLASLFENEPEAAAAAPLARATEQQLWTDPASGYQRRSLSPSQRSGLQLVEVLFPAGQRVAYETAEREAAIEQQIWVLEGAMDITVGETRWQLGRGDCLGMRLDRPILFHNPTLEPARYLVALASTVRSASER